MFNRIYALLAFCYIIISCSVGGVISCVRYGRDYNGGLNEYTATWPKYLDYNSEYSNPTDAILGLLKEMGVYSIDMESFEIARYKPWHGAIGYSRQEILDSICNSIRCYIVTDGEQIVLKEISDAKSKE